MWPPRLPNISPNPPLTSLAAARPVPLAHFLEAVSLVGLPGTPLPAGREDMGLSVPGPLPTPSLAGMAERSQWVGGVASQVEGVPRPLGFPGESCSGLGSRGRSLGQVWIPEAPYTGQRH